MLGVSLDNGQIVFSTINIPYKDTYLSDAFLTNKLSLDDFFNQLNHVLNLRDGGSKIYQYDSKTNIFGPDNFYVIRCNSLDGINDIYIAKNKDILLDKCNLKFDDLDGVSMKIKDGTLTSTSATVIITDISQSENIYGNSYFIEKKENESWIKLVPKRNFIFTDIGYKIGEDNTLEFKIDWQLDYGELESGEYRIVKDTSIPNEGTSHYITVEFILE